jgi:hypothetical protein
LDKDGGRKIVRVRAEKASECKGAEVMQNARRFYDMYAAALLQERAEKPHRFEEKTV